MQRLISGNGNLLKMIFVLNKLINSGCKVVSFQHLEDTFIILYEGNEEQSSNAKHKIYENDK